MLSMGCSDRLLQVVRDPRKGDGSVTPAPAANDWPLSACSTPPCACSDNLDNDGDGWVDQADPECSGPFDLDEASFATGLSEPASPCGGCFFDPAPGRSQDVCRYHEACFNGGVPSGAASASCPSCSVDAACGETCLPRTPNGCDCFGCCAIYEDTVVRHVRLGIACTMDLLQDPQACPPCTPEPSCLNPCTECELCLGRQSQDIPTTCAQASGQPPWQCEDSQACSAATPCPGGDYCYLGCCLPNG